MARPDKETVLRRQAADFEQFITDLGPADIKDPRRLVDELAVRLRRFAQTCEVQGVSPTQVRPARLALATLADQNIRARRGVDLKVWSGLARQELFDGREMGKREITEFAEIAKAQGADFDDLAAFLDHCLALLSGRRMRRQTRSGGGLAIVAMLLAGVLGLVGYVTYLEARFHRQALGAFTDFEQSLGLGSIRQSDRVVTALNTLSGDMVHVRAAVKQSPLRGIITLPFADAVGEAQARYRLAAGQAAAPLLVDAIGVALATEGQGLALYDTLRAYGILSGQTAWEPDFLAGWVTAREKTFGLQGFAAHVALIPGPIADLPTPDPVVLAQARSFAAETDEADRAWLEMLRAPEIMGLAPWDATVAVPRLAQVAVRKSQAPLQVPGLYTTTGWVAARDASAGVAVQKTRDLAQVLFGQDLPRQNDTPDLVMARQQTETIAFWQNWLADLRVVPFDVPATAIIVSGTLSQTASPLPALLQEVWDQVGGQDRDRPRPQQQEVARAFGPMIQYVEQGRMEEIAALFANVNVALSTRDLDQARGDSAITSVATRARSIQSLRAAPRVVVLLVEDTLAQISGGDAGNDPLSRAWGQVYGQCANGIAGRFPFGEGAGASITAVEQVLGPTGAIPLFFRQFAAPNLDMEVSPWRWKTEARFAGLSPETAIFFEEAMAISDGLFDGAGLGVNMTVAALAERGQATLSVGGVDAPVRANAAPVAVAWPGPEPQAGVSLQFSGTPPSAGLTKTGAWGLMRLLDGLRLRPRDDGQRFLIDMRDETGRLFVEMSFDGPRNPIAMRPLMQKLQCPAQL